MKSAVKQIGLATLIITAVALVGTSPVMAESLDEELEEYWATERDLEVLKERLYHRDGRIGVGLFTGLLSSEPFFYYFPVGLRATYHFSNTVGIEVGGAFMDAPGILTHNTELTDFLEFYLGEAGFDTATDTHDRFLWRGNATLLWSPFYGKLAALQRKLIHFDLNLAAGLGAVGVERPNANRSEAISTVTPELVLGAGFHIYLTPDFLVRLDGRGFLYRGAELPTNEGQFFRQLNFPVEFNLGATYMF